MGRERKGYLVERNGVKYIRLQFTDANGCKRDILRKVVNPAKWRSERNRILQEIEQHGEKPLDAYRMTFSHLADYFTTHYVKPAVYVENRKIEGYRSVKSVIGYLKALRAYFGTKRLQSITYGDVRRFRSERLATPTRRDSARHKQELETNPKAEIRSTRTIASVHRELALLRRMLNIACREGWILKNPFRNGEPLICEANETKRERLLSREEESRILDACVHPKRRHLRAILIYLLDTGCRQGEAFKLRWRDVDFNNRIITIQAFNTKTLRERQVSITTRLYRELERIRTASGDDPDSLVFGGIKSIRRTFATVCREAGIEAGLRRHDLRHTHATRLDDLGFSLPKIAAQLGHTDVKTSQRYTNRDKAAIHRVASELDAFYAATEQPKETETGYVN